MLLSPPTVSQKTGSRGSGPLLRQAGSPPSSGGSQAHSLAWEGGSGRWLLGSVVDFIPPIVGHQLREWLSLTGRGGVSVSLPWWSET